MAPTEYEITVNVDSRPKGDPIDFNPFGKVPNGDSFTAYLSKTEAERFEDSPHLKIKALKPRKKSELSDDDLAAYEAAEAVENDAKAQEEALAAMQEAEAEGSLEPIIDPGYPEPTAEGSDA